VTSGRERGTKSLRVISDEVVTGDDGDLHYGGSLLTRGTPGQEVLTPPDRNETPPSRSSSSGLVFRIVDLFRRGVAELCCGRARVDTEDVTTDEPRPAIELVVLLASAGGLNALSIVLRDLPAEFPAAVVVQQHLGGLSSVLPAILGRQTPHRVSWAEDGQAVAPGEVIACPPGVHLELTADGRCRLREAKPHNEQRFDVLLASVAKSYGTRGVAVVLSGSGQDGAVGTVAMKRTGAIVIAQSPDTAQYASMPIAAARAGADLVLPIYEIGHVLADIVAGAPPPKPRPRGESREIPSGSLGQCPAEGNAGDAPAAQRDGLTGLSPNHSANSAASRAELARLRAAELRRRHHDLSAGFGATKQTVAAARRRAAESLRRAQLAHQAAEEAAARWGQ
jgi:two-component system chemotaxis response regulator CheB